MSGIFDIFIIGGGINGAGIARDAAGRGYSVGLAEMNDLASGTSSWSSKLIHGGLRYLEHYEFRLVRESLGEREVLMAMAPHIIRPMRFVLPHHKALRPAWLLRLGLFLYDHIGKRKALPGTKTLDLRHAPEGEPLKPGFSTGFEYSDCQVDDARLVVLNAMDAAARGAAVHVGAKVTGAERADGLWTVHMSENGGSRSVQARMLVNAAGPWVDGVMDAVTGQSGTHNVRLVKGSHIVTPKLYEHDRAYLFQNADGRVVFAIPFQDGYTLIGTTDEDYAGEPGQAAISAAETDYLCATASDYFKTPVTKADIVWTYAGVRPLYDDGASAAQEATRDYVLKADNEGAPMLTLFGGKITTYRRLAEEALEQIEAVLGARGKAWTSASVLPGGDFGPAGHDGQLRRLGAAYPFLPLDMAARLLRLYGTRAHDLLGNAASMGDLGLCFGADLYEAEAAYLMRHEWARTADDVLWRRTKLGLTFSARQAASLDAWMKAG